MQRGERMRFVAVVGLVVALMTAGIGLASNAADTSSDDEPVTCQPVDETTEDGTPVDETEEPEGTDESEVPEESGGTDESDGTDESEAPEESDGTDDPAESEDCEDEAGDEETTDETEEPEKVTGLENAIAHVLENCIKNENAPGLITALEHLVANQERKADHDAWLEERRAEREAAKAEREAAREAQKAAHAAGRGNH